MTQKFSYHIITRVMMQFFAKPKFCIVWLHLSYLSVTHYKLIL